MPFILMLEYLISIRLHWMHLTLAFNICQLYLHLTPLLEIFSANFAGRYDIVNSIILSHPSSNLTLDIQTICQPTNLIKLNLI